MCNRAAFENFWRAGRDDAPLASKEADLAWTVWQASYHTALQDQLDAKRYRALRRGQAWSVINGIGDDLRGDELDAAIDARAALDDQPRAEGGGA